MRINFGSCRLLMKNVILLTLRSTRKLLKWAIRAIKTHSNKIDTFLLINNHKPPSNASNVFLSLSDFGSEQSSKSPSGSHSESELSSFFWIFSQKQSSSSGKRVDKFRFSRNSRDSIGGHISANGSTDRRPLEANLRASKMPAFFETLATISFPSSVYM